MSELTILSCLNSEEMAESRRVEFNLPRDVAADQGRSAVDASNAGCYRDTEGREVDWREAVQAACAAKRSIPPGAEMPAAHDERFPETLVQVVNETTMGAGRRLVDRGLRPLALNFANGVNPGGGLPPTQSSPTLLPANFAVNRRCW